MNVIDIVLMVVALIAFLVGWRKGLVSAIGGLVALVGAVWTARTYAAHLAEIFAGWWSEMDEKVLYIIAFALVFLVVNLVISLLAHLLESLLKALFLGWVNRLFGALLSVVIAAFMTSIVLNIYEFADKDHHLISAQQIEDSVLYDRVLSVLPAIVPDLKAFYQENMHELENLPKKALAGQQQI